MKLRRGLGYFPPTRAIFNWDPISLSEILSIVLLRYISDISFSPFTFIVINFFVIKKVVYPKKSFRTDNCTSSAVPPDLLPCSLSGMLNNAQPAAHLLILRMFRLQLLSVLHINSLCGVPTVSRSLEAIIYATFLNLRFLDHYSSVLSVLSIYFSLFLYFLSCD